MRQRLAEQWDSFARGVLPANAGLTQRWEMRRAFYAGAQALLGMQMTQLELGAEVTEADMDMMSGIQKELEQFVQNVRDGRA